VTFEDTVTYLILNQDESARLRLATST